MKLKASWSPDCQGKQDYDTDLVWLSCRFWPQGGGFSSFDPTTKVWKENKDRPEILPSARASIYLQDSEIAFAEFEGSTEAKVKAKVETWAEEQFNKIVDAMNMLYPKKEGEG